MASISANAVVTAETIAVKKKLLAALEENLKRKISELRELCMKEGEIIGHIPSDFPLKPREPIPQIRRHQVHCLSFAHNPYR